MLNFIRYVIKAAGVDLLADKVTMFDSIHNWWPENINVRKPWNSNWGIILYFEQDNGLLQPRIESEHEIIFAIC